MSEQVNKPKSDQTEIGALWKKEGKSQKFLAGSLDFSGYPESMWNELVKTKKLPVVIFTNKFKSKDSHPDLRIYLSKPKEGSPATVSQSTSEPVTADNEII